jgi:hypothetical protein
VERDAVGVDEQPLRHIERDAVGVDEQHVERDAVGVVTQLEIATPLLDAFEPVRGV